MDPRDRTAIVTGGGSGIGRATSLALAQAGANVVVADMDEGGGRETVQRIELAGARGAFVRTDVRSRRQVEEMVAFAQQTFGGLDILHANAGVGTPRPRFPEATADDWERTIAIDLWAVIACAQAAIPAMKRRGGGVIVNTASIAGLAAYAPDPIYAAAKHGVVGFTRSLDYLKAEANIRVNCVCPSFVDTPLPRRRLQAMSDDERAGWEAALTRVPMFAPSEVADVILDIIRDDAMAGQAIAMLYGQPHHAVQPPLTVG